MKVYVLAGKPGKSVFVGPFITYNHAHLWVAARFAQWQWFRMEIPPLRALTPEEAQNA